ncbi:MAG: acyl carrier protein [Blastocatellia bacterium]|jgi:acyl carrier protein
MTPLDRNDIRQRIERLLLGIAPEVDPRALDPGEELRAQVDLDSIDYLNLMIAIAGEFGVEIAETEYGQLTTLDQLIARIGRPSPTLPPE